MDQIKRHPFFTSHRPTIPIGVFSPLSLNDFERPVKSRKEIEADIFSNLRTLWHGASDEEIMEGLTNDKYVPRWPIDLNDTHILGVVGRPGRKPFIIYSFDTALASLRISTWMTTRWLVATAATRQLLYLLNLRHQLHLSLPKSPFTQLSNSFAP